MQKIRTHQEQSLPQQKGGEQTRTPGVEGMMLSYLKLPKNEITTEHLQHFHATREVLWDALDSYSEQIEEVLAAGRVSEYQYRRVTDDYYKVVETARRLAFPPKVLEIISFEFIDTSLHPQKSLLPHVRQAIADMGTAIGSDTIYEAKVRRIAEHHLGTLKFAQKTSSQEQTATTHMAESMLSDLGIVITAESIPSLMSDISSFTKEHSRKIAITGTAALLSTSILAPSMAHANEPVSPAVSFSLNTELPQQVPETSTPIGVQAVTQNGDAPLVIGMPTESTTVPESVSLKGSISQDETVSQPEVVVSLGTESQLDLSPITIALNPEAVPETFVDTNPIAIDVNAKAPKEKSITIGLWAESEDTMQINVADTIGVADALVDAEGNPIEVLPVPIASEIVETTPRLDEKNATPEQLAVQTITDSIVKDGDIATAASLLRLYFHDKSQVPTSFKKGEGIYQTTNKDLVKNIIGLEIAYEDLISKKGHADANYVNDTLIVYAVLEALANDQSILNSPDVQGLIDHIKRPDDDYQGKLFDQYVAKAKEALAANNSQLLVGINDPYKAQIETLYTYALLGNISDTDQAAQIQGIKDAEAAAAAKAAAEAAAEAARGNYNKTPEAEAIQNLIDREADPARKRTFMALQYLMVNGGFNAAQASGVIGNLLAESAGTMDPGIKQFGDGPGRGIAQWEGGRWTALQDFAAARGTTWDDFDTQLAFLLSELPGRRNTLEVIKGADGIYNAAREFMIRFETPRVVVDAYDYGDWGPADAQAQHRAERGQPILDALNAEAGAINAARQAAEQAEAKRVAEMGMNMDQALQFMATYLNSPDSGNYLGYAGQGCEGGPLSNCVSFSTYFINKYTSFQGFEDQMPGNGNGVTRNIIDRNPGVSYGSIPRPGAIFSTGFSREYGHTGIVLGVDPTRDVVIVGEAGCNEPVDWDTAREKSLTQWSNGDYQFVYTDGYIDVPLQ